MSATKFLPHALLFFVVFPNLSFASGPARSVECNGRLVRLGARFSEVSELCGEPTEVVERREFRTTEISQPTGDSAKGAPVVSQRVTSEVLIEEWSYDLGPNRFIRRLTFENGRLLSIVISDYGTR